ncbi:uncharacterized protein K444DRAFT_661456 [Hyaloscypha bicolor E]|uniref:Uncharacterized protein n=1 Tax=Hyaloscypha bicolor E TaxID=1095630 RepID=A0A2J6TGV2_9HELO|nr:uncharacterized protein K444DRAFT_661456 [Hyaloscypha bicolor E]PMD62221.1 hypothetical protein K444DRAFT_661456 [Hyaloscypha bicolor E]
MVAETPETVAAPPINGVIRAGHPNGNAFAAYPNDPNACSPNGKGPVQGVPGGSSHRDYGGNPLAHANTGESARFGPFAKYLQPGLYKPPKSDITNPDPPGLIRFTFTTFLLSLISFSTHGVTTPNIVVGPATCWHVGNGSTSHKLTMLDDLLGEQGLEFVGMCKTTPPRVSIGVSIRGQCILGP